CETAFVGQHFRADPPQEEDDGEARKSEEDMQKLPLKGRAGPQPARVEVRIAPARLFSKDAHTCTIPVRGNVAARPNVGRPPTSASSFLTKLSSTRSPAANDGSSASRKPRSPSTSVSFNCLTSSSV